MRMHCTFQNPTSQLPAWAVWLANGAEERRNLIRRSTFGQKPKNLSVGQKPTQGFVSTEIIPRWKQFLNLVGKSRRPGPGNRRRRHAPLSLQNKRQGYQRRGWAYHGRDALMARAEKRHCSAKASRRARNSARRALRAGR